MTRHFVNALVIILFTVFTACLLPAVQAENDDAASWITRLNAEKRQLTLMANQLQESIRSKTRQAAIQGAAAGGAGMAVGLAQGESLARDIALEDAKLTAMRATRIATLERMNNPGQIPPAVLMQLNPELARLAGERQSLQQQRDTTAQALAKPEDDPRVQQFDKRMKDLNDRMEKIITDVDGNRSREIQNQFRAQEEIKLYVLDQDIRSQEILVEALKRKFNEQLAKNAQRAGDILDTTFDQSQLNRVNKTLDQIEEQLIEIRMQQNGIHLSRTENTRDDSIREQLRRINERLDQIETRLHVPQPVPQTPVPRRGVQPGWRFRR